MTTTRKLAAALLLATLNPQLSTVFAQGSLTPPGAPAPTMKTLQQIEPRTPISSLPFTITNAGSYYATTNLVGGGANGLTIQTSDVTMDLNGFALVGSGLFAGVTVSGARTNIQFGNGTVRNWATGVGFGNARNSLLSRLRISQNTVVGLYAGSASQIESCLAQANAFGISVGDHGTVRDCVADANTGPGITVGQGCTVIDCSASANSSTGIVAGAACTLRGCNVRANTVGLSAGQRSAIKDCQATTNSLDGIVTGIGCTVSGCTAAQNTDDGIAAGAGNTISGCTVSDNGGDGLDTGTGCTVGGVTAHSNTGVGIKVGVGSSVSGCTARANDSDGIRLLSFCSARDNTCNFNANGGAGAGIHGLGSNIRIEANQVTQNGLGIFVDNAFGDSSLIICNSAAANGTNYVFVGTQTFGTTNAATGLVTTDPWRNFSF